MDERLKFIARLLDGEQMAGLCREFGISRKTGYKILTRYNAIGLEGLTDRSRRRRTDPGSWNCEPDDRGREAAMTRPRTSAELSHQWESALGGQMRMLEEAAQLPGRILFVDRGEDKQLDAWPVADGER
jgi:hypothetical protein